MPNPLINIGSAANDDTGELGPRGWLDKINKGISGPVINVIGYGAKGDGIVEDSTALQAAFAAGANGSVYLPPGTYRCTSVLQVSANCTVLGAGMGVSIITIPTNGLAANRRLEINQVSNVTLQDFTLRETGSTRTGVYGLLHITGATAGDTKGTLPKNIRISRVECDGSSGVGIMVQYGQDVIISQCFCHNGQADGIHIQRGSQDCIVTNNDCENNGDDDIAVVSHNYAVFGHPQGMVITGNRVGDQNSSLNLGAGISMVGCIGVTCTGNLIRNTRKTGITFSDLDETSLAQGRGMVGRLTIVGNEIYNAGLSAVGAQDGIGGSNCREVLIADNLVVSPNNIGIHLNGSMIDVSIRGNRIRNSITSRGIDIEPTNSVDANVLTLWTDALLTDGESKANVCAHHITVQDNSVGTTWADGIFLVCPAANPFDGLVCKGNEMWNMNKSNGGSARGLFIQYANDATVGDNQVRGGYNGNAIPGGNIQLLNITKKWTPEQPSDVLIITEAVLTTALDVSVANSFEVTLTAARLVIAPFFPSNGQRITFTFIQDGTGGRAVTWNAVFKVSWSDTGNTLNKRSSISFIYDGTNWNQDGAQSPYI